MSRTWFTADTHFGHKNIIAYSGRPFASVEEMDETLIANINAVVEDRDTLYHLGDWSFKDAARYRERVNCRNIILIQGNHDRSISKSLFHSIHGLLEIKIEDQPVTLCHYAMKVWNKSHHGAWHLYGHSHGSLADDPASLSLDIGVDCWAYKPVTPEEIREAMSRKTWRPLDHHGRREFEAAQS